MSAILQQAKLVVIRPAPRVSRALAERLGRGPQPDVPRLQDANARELGRVLPVDDRGALAKTGGLLLSIAGLGPSVGDARRRVVDSAGAPVLDLQVRARELTVRLPDGEIAGYVRNEARVNARAIDLRFYGPQDTDRRWGIGRWGNQVASLASPQLSAPFDWAIEADGRVEARLTNAGDLRNVLELAPSAAEPLRTLAVGLACASPDLEWIRPQVSRGPY